MEHQHPPCQPTPGQPPQRLTGGSVRTYFGGPSEATALITVVREIPSLLAICAFGTPSATSRRINAQSSKVITLRSW